MTDTPTTAPALLSRDGVNGWCEHLLPYLMPGDPMINLIVTAEAAYDPSGKLWSERAREAEEELADALMDERAKATELGNSLLARIASLERALAEEKEQIAQKAREWAGNYPQGSDGRNTFVLFAEWVESLPPPPALQSQD